MKKIRFIKAANNESNNIAGWLELADFSGTVTVVYNAGTTREQIEAHANEIVRRWAAFEDGGIVDELRKACEAIKDNKNKIYGFDIGEAIKKVEAALAKS